MDVEWPTAGEDWPGDFADLNIWPLHPPAGLPEVDLLADTNTDEEEMWSVAGEGEEMWPDWDSDVEDVVEFNPYVGENDPPSVIEINRIPSEDEAPLDWL